MKHKPLSPVSLPVEDAFELIGVGRTKGWELVRSGRLPTFKVGRRRLVHRQTLEEFLTGISGRPSTLPQAAPTSLGEELNEIRNEIRQVRQLLEELSEDVIDLLIRSS